MYNLFRDCERKCASEHIFYVEDCVTASGNISMFFNERAAASGKILRKNVRLLLKSVKRKNVQLLLRICPFKKYFEVKTD